MKELAMATLVAGGVCAADATSASRPLATADAARASRSGNLMPSAQANLPLTKEWDKVFPKSDKVEHSKATFRKRLRIQSARLLLHRTKRARDRNRREFRRARRARPTVPRSPFPVPHLRLVHVSGKRNAEAVLERHLGMLHLV